MKAMPPKLATNDGKLVVIRPLAYCAEKDIAAYARNLQFPIIPCDLCGSQENLQRKKIKAMLSEWEWSSPGRIDNIFRALKTVVPSHLADTELFDFRSLCSTPHDGEDDPLFGDDGLEATALSLSAVSDTRIQFVKRPRKTRST
jgi:tRNA 2-thiocytidine biosynthesis protein TtcA